MKLVLAEKPSVAQSLAKVIGARKRGDGYLEGNGYIVSWCVGHLVELAQPETYDEKYGKWRYDDLPILPGNWQYQVSSSTKKQFGILKKLMQRSDVESLVCATDAGREGELIFRLVYHQCGCKKPFERLWISSMEDSAIQEGFANLRNGTEYDALYEAALCRERSDWIVGINATRLFSCLYGQTLNVGRVMTPALAMVVMRDAAIRGFKPKPFYTVKAQLDGFAVTSERIKDKDAAAELKRLCQNTGYMNIRKAEKKEKQEKAPQLYDLTSLQRDANRQLGFTAQQTLDYTQNLYEKKLVTYPRTDSRFLTDDMEGTVPTLVHKVQAAFGISGEAPVNAKQVINSSKVTDHHAIIPTLTATSFDTAELPSGEKAVLEMIVTRLICAVGNPCRYSETTVEAECGEQIFKAKGKMVHSLGWKQYCGNNEKKDSDETKMEIPAVQEGEKVAVVSAAIKEGQTTPPKRYTEDLLLQAMESASSDEFPDEVERKGIGTPATRAGIIEKLVAKGFINRVGDKKTKYLVSTDKGTALITVIPEQIQSPSMTAEWEEKLLQVEKGQLSANEFMKEITGMISDLVERYEVIKGAQFLMNSEGKAIGNCPACGNEVVEKEKGWFCSNQNCRFGIWKDNHYFKKLGKKMTPEIAEKLVKEGKVALKGCISRKTGGRYNVVISAIPKEDGSVEFQMNFDNGGKRKNG
ncbi:MAG: DNA topoisomerase 3 [Eubacteriales bacterium]|nr:DNA topoisomerase 3 [Eubacteriales bacterium]